MSLDSKISGVLGLGFPRLSSFNSSEATCTFSTLIQIGIFSSSPLVTPFINGLAQNGNLDYPIFGLSLTRNDDGTLALGWSQIFQLLLII